MDYFSRLIEITGLQLSTKSREDEARTIYGKKKKTRLESKQSAEIEELESGDSSQGDRRDFDKKSDLSKDPEAISDQFFTIDAPTEPGERSRTDRFDTDIPTEPRTRITDSLQITDEEEPGERSRMPHFNVETDSKESVARFIDNPPVKKEEEMAESAKFSETSVKAPKIQPKDTRSVENTELLDIDDNLESKEKLKTSTEKDHDFILKENDERIKQEMPKAVKQPGTKPIHETPQLKNQEITLQEVLEWVNSDSNLIPSNQLSSDSTPQEKSDLASESRDVSFSSKASVFVAETQHTSKKEPKEFQLSIGTISLKIEAPKEEKRPPRTHFPKPRIRRARTAKPSYESRLSRYYLKT
ncbi:MAG: hypothetical protein ACFFBD_10310 [Candidatus Hodarchaeota archaeon]